MTLSRRSLFQRVLVSVPVLAAASSARAARAQQPASPKIALAEARKIALARIPGEILRERLKRTKKKGRLVYDLKIKASDAPKHTAKIRIDAETGEILRIKERRKK